MTVKVLTTGGTIDKIYFDARSEFQVGESPLVDLLREANVTLDVSIESILRKDSLELTDEDRALIVERVRGCGAQRVLITHGTDTMVDTARALLAVESRTVVLTGSMQPASLRVSDAAFNVGFALAAVQLRSRRRLEAQAVPRGPRQERQRLAPRPGVVPCPVEG